jgi:hypothetical protein
MIVANKSLNKTLWIVAFAVATLLTSRFIYQFKVFTLGPTWANGLTLLAVVLGIVASLLYLMYDTYVDDKQAGKVHHPFSLFEWVYQRHHRWLSAQQSLARPRPQSSALSSSMTGAALP